MSGDKEALYNRINHTDWSHSYTDSDGVEHNDTFEIF